MTTLTTSDTGEGLTTVLKIATLVAIVGALNWGLIGLFNWNLVDAIFGGGTAEQTSMPSRVVYTVVGLAGLLAAGVLASRRVFVAPRHA